MSVKLIYRICIEFDTEEGTLDSIEEILEKCYKITSKFQTLTVETCTYSNAIITIDMDDKVQATNLNRYLEQCIINNGGILK